jgi:hypothetical protein
MLSYTPLSDYLSCMPLYLNKKIKMRTNRWNLVFLSDKRSRFFPPFQVMPPTSPNNTRFWKENGYRDKFVYAIHILSIYRVVLFIRASQSSPSKPIPVESLLVVGGGGIFTGTQSVGSTAPELQKVGFPFIWRNNAI